MAKLRLLETYTKKNINKLYCQLIIQPDKVFIFSKVIKDSFWKKKNSHLFTFPLSLWANIIVQKPMTPFEWIFLFPKFWVIFNIFQLVFEAFFWSDQNSNYFLIWTIVSKCLDNLKLWTSETKKKLPTTIKIYLDSGHV